MLATRPLLALIEKTLLLVASPPQTLPSEAVPQPLWFARWKVSKARMAPGDGVLVAVGGGVRVGVAARVLVGIAVAVGVGVAVLVGVAVGLPDVGLVATNEV